MLMSGGGVYEILFPVAHYDLEGTMTDGRGQKTLRHIDVQV
jgi:hypothetical protein